MKWLVAFAILSVIIVSGCTAPSQPSSDCTTDSDCVVYGETGDCNFGCYHKDHLPTGTGGECFCLAPTSCKCIDGQCEGVFE